jgi:hypothetical protein
MRTVGFSREKVAVRNGDASVEEETSGSRIRKE